MASNIEPGRAPKGNNNVNTMSALPRTQANVDEHTSTTELLKRTPLDQLEETVAALKICRPAAEVRSAMVERIARAPLAEFDALKHIYLKYCGDVSR